MGVYYPPHFVLYGLLPVETAYTLLLVAHTIWGALGARWAALRFGASPAAASLAGFAWAASGFFVIHLPHQWGATSGCWMPWAWGLAWIIACGAGTARTALALAGVLTVQVLPGHFQIAFITDVGVLGLAAWSLMERPRGTKPALRGCAYVLASLAAIVPLAALQLAPTYELAHMAESHRDFEYLSGFATAPPHLISFLAPGLFHRSPLWRPVVWDPLHAMPEEQMAYVGLVPLFLALAAARRGWRDDRTIRALGILAIGSLVLSLGPYAPGFRMLIQLPGFSFFRAPARWGIATELALCLLAAKGFDGIREWPGSGRALRSYAAAVAVVIVLAIASFELALACTATPAQPAARATFERLLRALPWESERTFSAIMESTRQTSNDPRIRAVLSEQGFAPAYQRLDRARLRIYRAELGETALVVVGLLASAAIARRRRAFEVALLALTVADLLMLSRHREVRMAPLRPLASQSRVLAALGAEPRGSRSLDTLGNLPMVVGSAPVAAYRTLDRPIQNQLTRAVQGPLLFTERVRPQTVATLRALGIAVRVFGPFELAALRRAVPVFYRMLKPIPDPDLSAWDNGSPWTRQGGPRANDYAVWRVPGKPARAWLFDAADRARAAEIRGMSGADHRLNEFFASGRPLTLRAQVPERLELDVQTEGPAVVLITELDDPEWHARLIGHDGERAARVYRLFGDRLAGWQGIDIPGAGHWRLILRYEGRAARRGLAISAVAWSVWLLAYWWFGHQSRFRRLTLGKE
jgi:hypothetical protein